MSFFLKNYAYFIGLVTKAPFWECSLTIRISSLVVFQMNSIYLNILILVIHSSQKIFFSCGGGLDSTVLAALADRILPPDEPIDLLNVAFEQANYSFEVPDRLTAKQAFLGSSRKIYIVIHEAILFYPTDFRTSSHQPETQI